jgi:fatty acid desaturase
MTQPDKQRLLASHETHWSSAWLWLGFAVLFFALQGLIIFLYLHGAWWAAFPLMLLLGHLMHSHLLALHDATHETLCPCWPVNEAIGIFIGTLGLIEFSLFRVVHHTHHSYLGTERDEELWPFVNVEVPRWRRRLAAFLELTCGLAYTPFLLLRAFLRKGSTIRHPGTRRRIWLELALMVAVWTAILTATAYYHAWDILLVAYVIPAFVAGNLQSARKYIEHMGLCGGKILECTRTVIPQTALGRLVAFTLFHEPYHGVHHKYARLPHAALPQFSSILEPIGATEIPPFPNYRSAFLDMLTSLHDPRVGAQWLKLDAAEQESRRVVTRYRVPA